MIQLIIFAIIASTVLGVIVTRPSFLSQRYKSAKLSSLFLILQASYLMLVLIENKEHSEMWMFLALTYIPLAVFLFVVLLAVTFKIVLRTGGMKNYVYAAGLLLFHGAASYGILFGWSVVFDFPL